MNTFFERYRWMSNSFVVAVFLFLVVLMPLADAMGWIAHFTLNTWGKYLSYAVLALSIDLLWGYTGLLSLGQALFFSLGGYMMGMYLMLMIGKFNHDPKFLPVFMVFQGHTFLPAFWKPFESFGFALAMVILVPGMLAFIFGFLAFRSRVKGVYFSILTQALTYAASLMFFRNDVSIGGPWTQNLPSFLKDLFFLNQMPMGGNNGFTDFRAILGYDVRNPATQRGLYICTALLTMGVFLLCKWLTKTKFGLIQRAVRDSETRVLFSGYAAANFKLFVFVLCAVIASLGGALYVPQVGIINPSEMTPDKSLEAVVWVAVGGRGTLVGPIIGTIAVNAMKSWATRAYPDLWLIFLGGMFILIVLFMPKGIVGIPGQLHDLYRRLTRSHDEDEPAVVESDAPDATHTASAES